MSQPGSRAIGWTSSFSLCQANITQLKIGALSDGFFFATSTLTVKPFDRITLSNKTSLLLFWSQVFDAKIDMLKTTCGLKWILFYQTSKSHTKTTHGFIYPLLKSLLPVNMRLKCRQRWSEWRMGDSKTLDSLGKRILQTCYGSSLSLCACSSSESSESGHSTHLSGDSEWEFSGTLKSTPFFFLRYTNVGNCLLFVLHGWCHRLG